jgi:hypothetical protein
MTTGISFLPKKKICVLGRSVGIFLALLDNIIICGRVGGSIDINIER